MNGVRVADSLAFGLVRNIGKGRLRDHPSPVLTPQRRYIEDVVEWEETLPFVHIVTEPSSDLEEVIEFPEPRKSILKQYDAKNIWYNVHCYNPDPDATDQGRMHFPQLNTNLRTGIGRTQSPPPCPDEVNGIWEDFARRKRGERFMGPPLPKRGCPKSKSFC